MMSAVAESSSQQASLNLDALSSIVFTQRAYGAPRPLSTPIADTGPTGHEARMKPLVVLLAIIGGFAALLLILGVSVGHSAIYLVTLLILALPFVAFVLLVRWAMRRRRGA